MIQIDEHTFEMDWSNHQLEGVDGIQVTFFCFCFVYLVDVVGVLKLVNDKEVVGTQKFNCRLNFDKIWEDSPG